MRIYNYKQSHYNKRHYFANKGPSSQTYGFPSSHVWMWELDYKENWVWKNWCFWTVVLEKTLESPLDYKEIKLVNPKGNQLWIFIGKSDVEAETPILLATCCEELTHLKRSWCWEWLRVVEWDDRGWDGKVASPTQWTWVWITPGAGDGQEGLACWGHKESDTTEWLNWTDGTGCHDVSVLNVEF